MGTEKNRLNETVLLSTPLPPLFLTNIMITYFCHSCGSCSYALKYFCNVELMALNAFWWEMTSRHLTLRQSECILAGSDAMSPLSMDSNRKFEKE